MNEEEIKHQLFSDPDKFFDMLEHRNISLNNLKKLDIPRLIVRQRYKELISQENFDAAESVFWIAYFAEREIREDIQQVETQLGRRVEEIDAILDEMTFGKKIKFIADNYNLEGKSDALIKVLRSIKTLRNHMAHGRLNKLRYGRFSLADSRGQMKLTIDLMNAALKK